MDRIRLGHVQGDVAVRLRETLAVRGVSMETFTKELVKEHLFNRTALDATGHDVGHRTDMSNPDTIRIVEDPGLSLEECPTCGTPCLTCSDELMPVSEFQTIFKEALKKGLEEVRPRL